MVELIGVGVVGQADDGDAFRCGLGLLEAGDDLVGEGVEGEGAGALAAGGVDHFGRKSVCPYRAKIDRLGRGVSASEI